MNNSKYPSKKKINRSSHIVALSVTFSAILVSFLQKDSFIVALIYDFNMYNLGGVLVPAFVGYLVGYSAFRTMVIRKISKKSDFKG